MIVIGVREHHVRDDAIAAVVLFDVIDDRVGGRGVPPSTT
jgi:hypothetical protein